MTTHYLIDFSTEIDFGAPTACVWCGAPAHAKMCQPQRLADLLSAHATAWWAEIESPDFVERVNDTYDAYLAGGGNDAHYDANWRAFSDAAKGARACTT